MKVSSMLLKALVLGCFLTTAVAAQAALFQLKPYGSLRCSNADQTRYIEVVSTVGKWQFLVVKNEDESTVKYDLENVKLKVTKSMILSVKVIPGDQETAEIGQTLSAIAVELELSAPGLPKEKDSYICEKSILEDIS